MLTCMGDKPAGPRSESVPAARRPELPRRDHTHQTDEVGVARTRLSVVEDLRWVFRDQPVSDYGIDAHIEVVDFAVDDAAVASPAAAVDRDRDDLVTGQLIGVQAKSGLSCFREPTDGGWTFRETDRRHLNYWLGHSLQVIITLYHPEHRAVYWQHVNPGTVRRTTKGFTLHVPARQRLDVTARTPLEDIARRRGEKAVEALDRSLRQTPPEARAPLLRAAERDRPGAARLAQTLADGRGQPRLIASQLLAAAPTWLVTSPVAAQLWAAVGGFSIEHEHPDIAAVAFQRAADDAAEPAAAARWRAFAGLALVNADQRDRARGCCTARGPAAPSCSPTSASPRSTCPPTTLAPSRCQRACSRPGRRSWTGNRRR